MFGIGVHAQYHVDGSLNAGSVAVVVPVHQECVVIRALVVKGFVFVRVGSDIQTACPGTVQSQRGISKLPQVGRIVVHVHAQHAVLENAVGEHVLPVVLRADHQGQLAILAQRGAYFNQFVIVGGHAQAIAVQFFYVRPDKSCIGQAQRHAKILAVRFQQFHAEVQEFALPAFAPARLGIGRQVHFILAEFVVGSAGLHAVDIRAFAVVHLDLHIRNVIAVGHINIFDLDVGMLCLKAFDDLMNVNVVAGIPGLEGDGNGFFGKSHGSHAQCQNERQKETGQFFHSVLPFLMIS